MKAVRPRFLQALAVAAVAAAGILAYEKAIRPDRTLLATFAEEELKSIFGPRVTFSGVTVDLVGGVEIRDLAVSTPETDRPTLEARRVRVRHDVLALASGAYRPEAIEIEGARVVTHETESGVAPDFPFDLGASEPGGALPRLTVKDATFFYRAMPGSQRLREGFVLVLEDVDLSVTPAFGKALSIRGGFRTRGLAQDDVRIEVNGAADATGSSLGLEIVWSPFVLSEYLLDRVLAAGIAEKLRGHPLQRGKLVVSLRSLPGEGAGELRVSATWEGSVRLDVAEIPGAERIDARTREQLQALFSTGTLKFEVSEEGVDIQGLAAAVGGGEITASGRVEDEGEVMHLLVRIRGLRIEDPSIRKALGKEGDAIFDEFDATGRVDADVRITKERGKPIDFEVNAILEDATFRYLGTPGPDGRRAGFPYPVVNATGTVRITPGRVEVGEMTGVGAHSPSFFTLKGFGSRAWGGGETGRILLTDAGADIRLTIVGENVPVDSDLIAAVKGSEFSDILDTYRLAGALDHLEIDVILDPAIDAVAVTEMRITLGDTQFRYAKFPLPFEHVAGTITMRRPLLPTGKRGKVFRFDVRGRVDGAEAEARAEFREHENRGRLAFEAARVPLAGKVTEGILAAEGMQEGLGAAWRFLGPRGHASVLADFAIEDDPDPSEIAIRLHDASVRLDASRGEEAIELDRLTGWVLVRGDRVTIGPGVQGDPPGLTGRLEEVPVTLEGRVDGGPEGRWDLTVDTDVLRLSARLRAEMARLSGDASLLPEGWHLGDDGRMALRLHLRREAGSDSPVHADVVAQRLAAQITLPTGLTLDVEGERLSVRDDVVELRGITATTPGAEVRVAEGRIDATGVSGAFRLALDRFEATPEVLGLLPDGARDEIGPYLADRLLTTEGIDVTAPAEGGLTVRGSLTLTARDGAPPGDAPLGTIHAEPLQVSADVPGGRTVRGVVRVSDFVYDPGIPLEDVRARVRLDDLRLGEEPSGSGAIEGLTGKVWVLTVRDLSTEVRWRDGILGIGPVRGLVADGRLSGRALVHTREPMGYEGSVRIDRFDLRRLREDLSPSGPPFAGLGNAEVNFQNRGGRLADLTAAGRISVRDGNLGDLPAVANIFALLGGVLRVDDPPKFERADVEFTLQDEVIRFQKLEIAGPLFEMPGRGTIDLAGTMDITFTPDVIKSLLLPGIMQLPLIGDIVGGVLQEQLLYAVRLRGDLDTVRPEIVPFPPLGLDHRPSFPGTGVPEPLPRRVPRWFR